MNTSYQDKWNRLNNPKTIEDLQKKGVKFEEKPQKTEAQFLDELFDKRRKTSTALIQKFPSAPQIAIPTVGFLYDEIRECILFSQFGAATTLENTTYGIDINLGTNVTTGGAGSGNITGFHFDIGPITFNAAYDGTIYGILLKKYTEAEIPIHLLLNIMKNLKIAQFVFH